MLLLPVIPVSDVLLAADFKCWVKRLTLRPTPPQTLKAAIEHLGRVFLPGLFGVVAGCVQLGDGDVEVVLVVSPHVG